MRLLVLVLVLACLAGLSTVSGGAPAETSPPILALSKVPVLLFEPPADQAMVYNRPDRDYLDYAWRSFIALNWPADLAHRGEPDTKTRGLVPGARSPAVWETWPYTQDVFLPSGNWDDYPTWQTVGPPSTTARFPGSNQPPERPCPNAGKDDLVLQAIDQPGLSIKHGAVGPLYDQNRYSVRYQVGLNRSYFDYVKTTQYYQAELQAPPPAFVPLPHDQSGQPGMIEYKSAWKVLGEGDDPGRFYQRQAYYLSKPAENGDCQGPFMVGLVAFHIHRRTYFSHVAATFEQVDNVEVTPSRLATGARPSFNPGLLSSDPPPYGQRGYVGPTPKPVSTPGNHVQLSKEMQPASVSRATPIPAAVERANESYRTLMGAIGSVLSYYQLINVQHAAADCARNWQSGKWSEGCPKANVDVLINAALESYTQLINLDGQPQNYSCKGCHQHARPCGVSWKLVPEYQGDLMSYLLSKAKSKSTTYDDVLGGYNCNRPADWPAD